MTPSIHPLFLATAVTDHGQEIVRTARPRVVYFNSQLT